MPIHPPGERFRYSRLLGGKSKREVTSALQLTAMVDMFTVLVIFLLQNYNATGQALFIPKEVILPKAEKIKELKPAVIVTISNKEVLVDRDRVVTFDEIKAKESWMIDPLMAKLKIALAKAKEEQDLNIQKQLNKVFEGVRGEKPMEDPDAWNKVTIQSDKDVDFLTVKKVMYTVTEAGAAEINFAVMKQKENQ